MSDAPSPLWSRRAVVGAMLAVGAMPARGGAAAISGTLVAGTYVNSSAMPSGQEGISGTLVAGTYVNEGGAGLVPLRPAATGWAIGTADAAIRNASFGIAGRARGLRYLLDEQTEGRIGVYDANWRRLFWGPTQGADPCHVALSPDGASLAAANYSSGSVALWSLDPATGLPRGDPAVVQHQGHGPNAARQAGAHAHWVGFTADGSMLHSVDLGADAIFAHRLDRARARVVDTAIAYRAVAASGPRHLARHPRLPIAYLVAELANTVTTLQVRPDGYFAERAVHTTLPAGFAGESFAAHIAIDAAGDRLYVSNRGHDSIVVFAIGRDGGLTLLQHAASGGHWPRFFMLLPARGAMLVANERSGTLARLPLRRDGRLGAATPAARVPGIVFLLDG